jgi:hypothetical protein
LQLSQRRRASWRRRLSAQRSSKPGKTLVVATTHGKMTSAATIDGKPVIVGVNAYIRAN